MRAAVFTMAAAILAWFQVSPPYDTVHPAIVTLTAIDQGTSGTFAIGDGTALLPSLYFSSDRDVGFYHEAANEINITSNGKEVQEIKWTGSNAQTWFYNPNHATNSAYGSVYTGSSTGSRWQMYEAATSSSRIEMSAQSGYSYAFLDTPDGGYAHWGLRSDATTQPQLMWLADNEVATTPSNYLALQPDAEPSGASTITIPVHSGHMQVHQQGISTLTDAAATSILSFPLADADFIAGSLATVVTCTNASNTVVRHDEEDFVCLNSSDTESCSFQSELGSALELNDGAGTYSGHAFGVDTSGTNTVTMTLNANCSLGTITLLEAAWEIEFHHPDDAPVVTEVN